LKNFYRRDTNDGLEPVDINGLAAGTISLTRPRWRDMPRQHGITIEIKEDFGDVGFALGNAAELRDALTNLLFNAVDAMPGGGEITVRTRRLDDSVWLEVQDSGTGM
jgi:signal transduction histidine kinase